MQAQSSWQGSESMITLQRPEFYLWLCPSPTNVSNPKLHHLSASDSQSRNTLCDCRESTRCKSNAFQYSNLITGVEYIFSSVDMLRHLKKTEKVLWSSPRMGSKCLILQCLILRAGATPDVQCQCKGKSGPSF